MAYASRKIFQRFQACFQLRSLNGSRGNDLSGQLSISLTAGNPKAYIQQNDVFVGALTVEEHLFLQSKVNFQISGFITVKTLYDGGLAKVVITLILASIIERI